MQQSATVLIIILSISAGVWTYICWQGQFNCSSRAVV